MRFTISRHEQGPRKAALAVACALTVLAAGGLLAAPRGTADWSIPAISLQGQDGYAVRFALPAARGSAVKSTASGNRKRPLTVLAELEEPPAAEPEVEAAAVQTLPAPAAARPDRRAKVPGVMPLNYSLAGGADASDAIEVEKPVVIGDADAGRIPLRIDGNARVYALGSRLAAIIAAQSGEKAVPAGLDQDFVSLERLRALGIGVRYDAIRDRLVVELPGA